MAIEVRDKLLNQFAQYYAAIGISPYHISGPVRPYLKTLMYADLYSSRHPETDRFFTDGQLETINDFVKSTEEMM